MANKLGRVLELDGLRGVAAITVVLYHFTTRFTSKFGVDFKGSSFSFDPGHYGVQLFFIISGFVIFMTVEKINNPIDFSIKRFIRLYPTFWICVSITFIYVNSFGPEILKRTTPDLLLNLTMLPNLLRAKAIDGVYWTLLIELGFYAFIFILLIFKGLNKIIIIGFVYNLILLAVFIFWRFFPYAYYGSLFITGISFYLIWKGSGKWYHHLLIMASAVLTFFTYDTEVIFYSFCCYFLFYLFVLNVNIGLRIPLLVFVGEISYALYLLHQNIGHTIQLQLMNSGMTNFYLLLLIPIIVSVTLACLVTYIIERPIVRRLTYLHKNNPMLSSISKG